MSEEKTKPRCGMCNCEWTEGHEKTPKHQHFIRKFQELRALGLVNKDEIVRKMRESLGEG